MKRMAVERPRSFRLSRSGPPRPQVGVPRRFSIGTGLILIAVFAVLFSVLEMLQVPPEAFICISIFVGGVAASQAILFKGKNPRAASIIAGAVLFYVTLLVVHFVNGGRPRDTAMVGSFGGAMVSVFIGGLLGYLVGGLVAAVFLVRKEPEDPQPQSPAASDSEPSPQRTTAKSEVTAVTKHYYY